MLPIQKFADTFAIVLRTFFLSFFLMCVASTSDFVSFPISASQTVSVTPCQTSSSAWSTGIAHWAFSVLVFVLVSHVTQLIFS